MSIGLITFVYQKEKFITFC